MPNEPFLPLEILEVIIKFTFSEQHTSSKVSNLAVCRALLPVCRQHMFREVEISRGPLYGSPNSHLSRVRAFLHLLQSGLSSLGSGIGHYVRVLRIENNFSPLLFRIMAFLPRLQALLLRVELREELVKDYARTEALNETFDTYPGGPPLIVNREILNKLESIGLGALNLKLEMAIAPLPPLHLPRLYIRDVYPADHFSTFNFLTRCIHLQTRNLTRDEIQGMVIDPPLTAPRSVTVQRLEISDALTVLGMLLDMEHTRSIFTGLQEVSVNVAEPGDLKHPLRLFTHTSGSLRKLDLIFYNRNEEDLYLYSGLSDLLTLAPLTQLTHLSLINFPRSPEQFDFDFAFPEGIISLFHNYRGTILEQVRMEIPWWSSQIQDLRDQDGSWSRMRRVIIDADGRRQDRFPRLKVFSVRITVRRHGRKKWKEIFQAHAPMVLEKARDLLDLKTSGISGGVSFNTF